MVTAAITLLRSVEAERGSPGGDPRPARRRRAPGGEARPLYPDLAIVARGHDADVSARLGPGRLGGGAGDVGASLIIAEAALRRLAVPEDVVEDAAELVRRYHSRGTR